MEFDNPAPSDAELVAKMKALREANWPERLAVADKVRLVIAGNHREFLAWCRKVNRQPSVDARFISRASQLRGIDWTKFEVVLVGTYEDGEGWADIFSDLSFIQKQVGMKARKW